MAKQDQYEIARKMQEVWDDVPHHVTGPKLAKKTSDWPFDHDYRSGQLDYYRVPLFILGVLGVGLLAVWLLWWVFEKL